MLELGDSPRAGRLCRSVAAHAGLHILLHLIERRPHALAMGFAHTIIAANKRGQRDGFRCAERRIPARSMLH